MIANGTWSLDPSPAIKQATDGRFKASSVFALIAWGVIVVSVGVSLKFYPPVSRRVPPRIPLCLTAMLVRVVYNIAVAWNYNIGPLKPTAPVAYVYVLGFLPILFCMAVMIISARIEPNDDQRIIKLRRERERVIDIELDDQRRVVQEERARERQEQLGPGSMLKMPASSSAASADTRSGELSTITTPPPVYEA